MNKTKTILAAVGGVTLVAVAAAGYFVWSANTARTIAQQGDEEGETKGLEPLRETANGLSGKPIYPGPESVKALTEAREELVAWKTNAFLFASRGDRKYQRTGEAELKEFIVSESQRLRTLPVDEAHKMLDESFDFGPFKPYISDGVMPEKASLNELERKWDDVSTILEVLSSNGVTSVSSIALKAAVEQQPKEEDKPKKGKKKAKKKSAQVSVAAQPVAYAYALTCKMHPSALVKTLNALAKSERFMVVTDVTFTREKDVIAERLGASAEKKAEEVQTQGRRKRARRDASAVAEETEEKPSEEQLYTVVTDPAEELPFNVNLTVTVYDFRTFEENKEEEVEK